MEATLATPYQLQGQTLRLPELALRAPRSTVDGALTIDLERTLIDGTVRGRVQDLAALRPLLPMPLRGAVDLDATLTPGWSPAERSGCRLRCATWSPISAACSGSRRTPP